MLCIIANQAVGCRRSLTSALDGCLRAFVLSVIYRQFAPFIYFIKFYLMYFSHLAGATMLGLVKSCIGTKFTSQFGDLIAVSSLLINYCLGEAIIYTFSIFTLSCSNPYYFLQVVICV